MAGMVGQDYRDEQLYYYFKNRPNEKPSADEKEKIRRHEERIKEQKRIKKESEYIPDSNWEWSKKNLCNRFKPYFNESLGVRIESREQIRDLERQGTTFMSVDEYKREGYKIKSDIKKKKDIKTIKSIKSKLEKIRSVL